MAVNTKLQDKIEKVLVEQQVEKDAEMAEMLAVSPARSSATYQYSRWFRVLLGPKLHSLHWQCWPPPLPLPGWQPCAPPRVLNSFMKCVCLCVLAVATVVNEHE